jgi:uncharacterized damage-inducible protein DinB
VLGVEDSLKGQVPSGFLVLKSGVFDGMAKPEAPSIEASASMIAGWDELKRRRKLMDDAIADWASRVDEDWLADDLRWFSGAAGREVVKPCWFLVTHFFNHQTHHRGQVHAMLTAAGRTT